MALRLWLVVAGNGLLRIAGGASGVLVGVYVADLARRGRPVDAAFVGVLAATSFAAELAGSVPFGFAADVVSTRTLMTGGALAAAIAAAVVGVTADVGVLVASRVLEGLAAAASVPALLAHLTDATARDRRVRARAMSYFELSLLVGLALGGVLGSLFWRALGVGAFIALGAVYGVAAILMWGAAPSVRSAAGRGRWPDWAPVLAEPALWRLAPVWLCMNAIVGLWIGPTLYFLLTNPSTSGQFLSGLLSNDPTWLGVLLAVYASVFGVGVLIWSRILPGMGAARALGVALVAMVAVCVAMLLLNHAGSASIRLRWGLTSIIALLIMVESGFTPAALSLLAAVVSDRGGRGAAMGIYSFLLSLGALGGSLLAGAAGRRWEIDGLVFATLALAVLALVLLRSLLRVPLLEPETLA